MREPSLSDMGVKRAKVAEHLKGRATPGDALWQSSYDYCMGDEMNSHPLHASFRLRLIPMLSARFA